MSALAALGVTGYNLATSASESQEARQNARYAEESVRTAYAQGLHTGEYADTQASGTSQGALLTVQKYGTAALIAGIVIIGYFVLRK